MNKVKSIACWCFLGLVLGSLIGGCSANPFRVKVLPYSESTSPDKDETLIYVFRENSGFGGARKFAIICNDTIMDVLFPGTFSHFIVKSGENEIVAYMSPSPIMHYRVQSRPGQTVYLFCKMGYTTGIFIEEIDEQKANELMKKFKYTDIEIKNQKHRMNYKTFYDNLYK